MGSTPQPAREKHEEEKAVDDPKPVKQKPIKEPDSDSDGGVQSGVDKPVGGGGGGGGGTKNTG